jgi:cytochrome c biogenesis protein CcmG/thiol:disulfide interchange protein DsbE
MPALQQVYLQAKDKVAFLGLDSRDVQDGARRFAAQTGVTYPLAADPNGQAAAKLGVAGLPTTVFIAADGTLRGRHVGALTQASCAPPSAATFGSASPDGAIAPICRGAPRS